LFNKRKLVVKFSKSAIGCPLLFGVKEYTFFYKKHVYKKHEAEIMQKLRNI